MWHPAMKEAPRSNERGALRLSDLLRRWCPRQGTTQKDDPTDLRNLVGRLVIKGSFEPVSWGGAGR